MGDIVFVDLPSVGTRVEAGDELMQVESSKAVEPVISPVAGTVKYVNHEAEDDAPLQPPAQCYPFARSRQRGARGHRTERHRHGGHVAVGCGGARRCAASTRCSRCRRLTSV